jgi:hypothetical protein
VVFIKKSSEPLFTEQNMENLNDTIAHFSNLSMDQVNALIALFGLTVAGLAVYLATVAIKAVKK